MLDGRLEEAARHAAEAASRARERGEHGFLAHAERRLGDIAGRQGALATARQHYEQALQLAREREMAPLAAACEAELARLGSVPP